MESQTPIQELALALGITLRENDFAAGRQWLADTVNDLLQKDFQRLVSLLYRLDVSEARLKYLLKEHPGTDAGLIIADLMIERQAQKIKSRQQFRQKESDMDEEERW